MSVQDGTFDEGEHGVGPLIYRGHGKEEQENSEGYLCGETVEVSRDAGEVGGSSKVVSNGKEGAAKHGNIITKPMDKPEELGSDGDITWGDVQRTVALSTRSPTWWVEDTPPFICKTNADQISRGFSLSHITGTKFIHHPYSDTTVARCTDGVYAFGTGWEYGSLVSRTNKGALEHMLNPEIKPEGPVRRAGSAYDPTKPDVFDNIGYDGEERESEEEDERIDETVDHVPTEE